MGEYATYRRKQIKIGTCEDMYYLRFDQRTLVQAEEGSVDPVADHASLRFRFPWPDEDHIAPGSDAFHKNGFHRAVAVPGFPSAAEVEHHTIQFHAPAGYLVLLPCPESTAYTDNGQPYGRRLVTAPEIGIARNGFVGAAQLVAQKFVPSVGLVPILRCGGCGAMWREESPARIEQLAVAFRSEGDQRERKRENGAWWLTVADRLRAGLSQPQPLAAT